jgi:cell division protein FtsQ
MWNNANALNKLAAVLITVATLALAWAGVQWLARHPWFAIKTVRIVGDTARVNEITLRTSLVKRMRGTFFTTNLAEIKRSAEGLPWVRRAQVSRHWPNAIVIRLEAHQPLARLNEAQLVNTLGEAFTVNLGEVEMLAKLPEFVGPEGTSAQMSERYRVLRHHLEPLGLQPVRVLLSDRLSWTVGLQQGTALELGRDIGAQPVEERLIRFAQYWDASIRKLGVPQRVDLRYRDGFAFYSPGLRVKAGPQPSAVRTQ